MTRLPSRGPGNGSPKKDFEAGNTLSVRHGTYSPRKIAERAELVHEALLLHAPWLEDDAFVVSVNRYLQATAREQLAHEALLSSEKLSPRLLEVATAASRLAWRMGDELGLTPAGHAKLKLLTAGATEAEASLMELAAEGKAAEERREAREAAERAAAIEATAENV
jgi:hypothetical protein